MKVFFSDRPALYFIKQYAEQNLPGYGEIEWIKVDQGIFGPKSLLDKTEIQAQDHRFRSLLHSLEEGSMVCYSINDFGDYFAFTLFYKLFEAFLRDESPKNLTLVTGGALFGFIDQDGFQEAFPRVDTIVVGAGEKVFAEILDTKLGGGNLPRRIEGDSKDRLRFPSTQIVTSRFPVKYLCSMSLDKCEWGRCKFCHHLKPDSVDVGSIQEFSDNVIRLHKEKGIRHFYVFDNFFTPRNAEIFLSTIDKAGMNNKFMVSIFGARADRAFLELAPLFKQTGNVKQIAWGLESFSQKILALYSKGIKASNFEPILKSYSELGISNVIYMLFGLPSTTEQDIQITFDGLNRLRPHYQDVHFSWFLASRGIDVFANPTKYQITILDRYKVSDALGVDLLGRYDIDTVFYDFISEIEGRELTRRQDFDRYVPYFFELERSVKWPKANPTQLFLRSMGAMALFAASSHFWDAPKK